jgi:hypothetical protein
MSFYLWVMADAIIRMSAPAVSLLDSAAAQATVEPLAPLCKRRSVSCRREESRLLTEVGETQIRKTLNLRHHHHHLSFK